MAPHGSGACAPRARRQQHLGHPQGRRCVVRRCEDTGAQRLQGSTREERRRAGHSAGCRKGTVMSIGEPLARLDGRIKVTGAARYTADLRAPNMLHGVFVTASIPAGKVIAFDKGDALAEPGVVRVLTHEDVRRPKTAIAGPPFAHSFLPLQDDEIRHEGQPIAMVLAETLEAAEAGARERIFLPQRKDRGGLHRIVMALYASTQHVYAVQTGLAALFAIPLE